MEIQIEFYSRTNECEYFKSD